MRDLFGLDVLSGHSNIEVSRWAVATIVEARCLKFRIALRHPGLVDRARPYLARDELFSAEETANLRGLCGTSFEELLGVLNDYSPRIFALLAQYGLEPVLTLNDRSTPCVVLRYIVADTLESEDVSN